MSLKAQAAGLAIGGAAIILGLWWVKRSASDALSSLGSTLSALPGQAVDAIGSAYSESATLDATNYQTLADGNRAVFGVGDAGGAVAPYGSVGITVRQWWNDITGNDAAGLDYGTGANDWSS